MERPTDIFDRHHEWNDLAAFAQRPGRGFSLALVHGRRRQGKSFLLRRLARATGGFYHQAVEEERSQALDRLGSALGEHWGLPGGRLALGSWDEALGALRARPAHGPSGLVVIDELPYLLAHSPELPSVLQRTIDDSRDGGPARHLVLCGSALSVMARLLTGAQALRGRAVLDLVVRPFDFRTTASYWGIADPHTAFLLHAVLGGTPGYRDLLPARPPRDPADVGRWLAEGPLNPSSALFREDDHLLTEEQALTDRALYHAVLTAIAGGRTTQGAIAAALGREARAVQHPLRALVDAGFVTRTDDALRSRRPVYGIADPIIRFHHVVTRRDMVRFEERRTVEAWIDAQPRFRTHVLGPHFEHLAREFTSRWASPATIGGSPTQVGPAVVNEATARTQHQVDVVALGRDAVGGTTVLALGEAKYTTTPRDVSDLTRLDHIRGLVATRHPTATRARLLLFSATGFTDGLRGAASERGDIELVDLPRLLTGD